MPTQPDFIGIQRKSQSHQMVQTPTKPWTLEEFLELPETKPASEYVDGQIIQKPMQQGEYSTIQGELIIAINAVVKPKKVARAFPERRSTFDSRSPDVTVFTWGEFPAKKMAV